jgi:hypothetical protein
VKVAASTVWQILKDTGIDPAPHRSSITWATFLRNQAEAIVERRVGTRHRELLDRTLIWNHAHLIHALREFETHYNTHSVNRCSSSSRTRRLSWLRDRARKLALSVARTRHIDLPRTGRAEHG